MIINRANLAGLTTGFKTIFNNAFEGAPSHWDRVAMLVPSSTKQETYAWLGSSTRFREFLGERVIQNLANHDYTIKNVPFENTVGVDRDDIEDDTYGVYSPMIAQLGQDAKTHPDELVFRLLKDGFTKKGYDGQNFFDADHPYTDADGVERSQSNVQAGAKTPWFLLDVSRAIKPLIFQRRKDYQFVAMDQEDDEGVFMRKQYRYGVDARCNVGFGLWQFAFASKADLTAENYAAARAQMMSVKGDHGKPINVTPSLLVVPPTLERAALEILKAERDVNGATNVYQGSAELLATPWLG